MISRYNKQRSKILFSVLILFINHQLTIQHPQTNLLKIDSKKLDNENSFNNKIKCSTLSCVHSSAIMLQKLDLDTKPCDDFYRFACGGYIQSKFTPDEKSSLDTLTIMYDQLIEYLLRQFEFPSENLKTKKIHDYAYNFFDSCMDVGE